MSVRNFILLAEDDEDDQELIKIAFGRVTADHEIKIVSNGQEALDILMNQNKLPCLIILDLNMPLLNGLQTLQALTYDPRFQHVPKVIFTTSDSEDNKRNSYTNGAVDYFIKPNTMKDFVTAAQKMLTYCR